MGITSEPTSRPGLRLTVLRQPMCVIILNVRLCSLLDAQLRCKARRVCSQTLVLTSPMDSASFKPTSSNAVLGQTVYYPYLYGWFESTYYTSGYSAIVPNESTRS